MMKQTLTVRKRKTKSINSPDSFEGYVTAGAEDLWEGKRMRVVSPRTPIELFSPGLLTEATAIRFPTGIAVKFLISHHFRDEKRLLIDRDI